MKYVLGMQGITKLRGKWYPLELQADPFEVYRTLRVVNPSPFMFFLRSPEVTLVGSSPEIMCRVIDNEVTVRPLAGTRWAPPGTSTLRVAAVAGWAMARHEDDRLSIGWVECGPDDANDMVKSLVDLALAMGTERVHLAVPVVDWLLAALETSQFGRIHPMVVYELGL